jgi:DNA-binding response OmpR family regulator
LLIHIDNRGDTLRKPRILLFDDEPLILNTLKDYLSAQDYEVMCFEDPTDCPVYEKHENCKKEAPCADVLITDFKMNKMNGIEWIQLQKERGCQLDMKNKAVISGKTDEEQEEIIKKMGCAFFLKPFKFSVLSAWIQECVERVDLTKPLDYL